MDREEALEWLQQQYPKLAALPHIYETILDQCVRDSETGQRLVPTETPVGIKYTAVDGDGAEETKSSPLETIPETPAPPEVTPEDPSERTDPEETPETLSVTFEEKVEIIDNNI